MFPRFPTLNPNMVDTAWFNVDQPCDDENEVAELEKEHQAWRNGISQWNSDLTPIGKSASENLEDVEEEEDEDDNDDDDDESETHDEEDEDEIVMDVSQERNVSPVDVTIRMATA